MADNDTLPATGDVIASDRSITTGVAANAAVQRVKAGWGAAAAYNDPAVATPVPVQASEETSQMTSLGTVITPQFAVVNVSSSGDNPIVAAVAGKVTRVLSYVIVADAAVAATWRSATTALTGAMSLAANGGVSAPYCPVGHFQTGTNVALNLNLGAAVGARGHVTYVNL